MVAVQLPQTLKSTWLDLWRDQLGSRHRSLAWCEARARASRVGFFDLRRGQRNLSQYRQSPSYELGLCNAEAAH